MMFLFKHGVLMTNFTINVVMLYYTIYVIIYPVCIVPLVAVQLFSNFIVLVEQYSVIAC